TGPAAPGAWARGAPAPPCGSAGAGAADTLLHTVQHGEIAEADRRDWAGMDPRVFFAKRVLMDLCGAYYSHPYAWNEIGFGGPASPRGYVRMDFNRRDPWEARVEGDDDGR
ncbi:gluconate 2-dehydrogenase subunit 3 family protein, partial [Burkholderia pseudomultivorans]|uniref:gluconate 2-dehydrogenase subunit 3 family protein n=1 Tax=Burkholderia pseudomultivorans TaxID=1207504 RepID=UPI00287603D6